MSHKTICRSCNTLLSFEKDDVNTKEEHDMVDDITRTDYITCAACNRSTTLPDYWDRPAPRKSTVKVID